MVLDADTLWAAIEAADPRFDGWVYCGVTSTGIYCRPSCPARTPKRDNVRLYATAAAAQAAGFRACKRCRPDAAPGSPEWDRRSDVVGRAMRLIADGVVDRDGVAGLARSLGYTERHLHRQLVAAVGVGPRALARAHRAQTAQTLLQTTDLPMADVAFAAGFASVRQFNATVREIFALTPTMLRRRMRDTGGCPRNGALSLKLPYRAPLDGDALMSFLAARCVPGIEGIDGTVFRRSLRLPRGTGVVALEPLPQHVDARFVLDDLRDLATAVQRCRAFLDLDADPLAVSDALGDDALIGRLVRSSPGLRVTGHVDPHELASRAILGQQVSLAAAVRLTERLVTAHGDVLKRPVGAIRLAFPTPEAIAGASPESLGLPLARSCALIRLAHEIAAGRLELGVGADRACVRRKLAELPGIGPWTTEYIAMRALRDPDAYPANDLGLRRALTGLAPGLRASTITTLAERWRPYRAYAAQHLWKADEYARRDRDPTGLRHGEQAALRRFGAARVVDRITELG